MVVKGRLSEVALPELLKVAYDLRLTAVLKLWERRSGHGVIYIDQGSLVRADADNGSGEVAFYRMAQWEEALFRFEPTDELPLNGRNGADALLPVAPRTLIVSDAVQQLIGGPHKSYLSDDEAAEDDQLEYELIRLLANLENGKEALAQRRVRRNLRSVIQIIAQLFNDVLIVAELWNSLELASAARLLAMAAARYPAASQLPLTADNLLDAEALGLIVRHTPSAERAELATALFAALSEMLESGLLLIVARFHARETATQWQQAIDVFLLELEERLQKVHV